VCLITVRIAVRDGPEAAAALVARRAFEPDPTNPEAIAWYGQGIPDEEARAMMAEAIASVGAQGHPGAALDEQDGPRRWIQCIPRVEGDQIVAQVHSEQRLARLVHVLEPIGADPKVTEAKRIDPRLDLPRPGGERATPQNAGQAAEGWEKAWLDRQMPALAGHTPRQAAEGKERPGWGRCCASGSTRPLCSPPRANRGIDTGWLRAELSMDAEG
jgi:hypothetical protein